MTAVAVPTPAPLGTLASVFWRNAPGMTDVITETILLALGYVAVGLRLWSRRLQRAQLLLNDWLILVAMLLMSVRYALETAVDIECGIGLHVAEVKEIGGPKVVVLSGKLVYIIDLLWVTLVTLIKLSILHFYLTVFKLKAFKIVTYVVIGLCISFWFGAFFATAFFCTPPQKEWYPNTPGHCGDSDKLYAACASTDLAIDVIVIMLPMPVLWSLQLRTARKIALTFVFGLGFAIIAITSVRIKIMLELDEADPTYSASRMGLFSAIVPLLGIVNACLPILPPAFKKIFNSYTMSSTVKQSVNTRGSDGHQFKRLGEPEFSLVDIKGSRINNTNESTEQIRVTTNWEVRSAEAGMVPNQGIAI